MCVSRSVLLNCLQVHHVPRRLEKAADSASGQDFPCLSAGLLIIFMILLLHNTLLIIVFIVLVTKWGSVALCLFATCKIML